MYHIAIVSFLRDLVSYVKNSIADIWKVIGFSE